MAFRFCQECELSTSFPANVCTVRQIACERPHWPNRPALRAASKFHWTVIASKRVRVFGEKPKTARETRALSGQMHRYGVDQNTSRSTRGIVTAGSECRMVCQPRSAPCAMFSGRSSM